MSPYEMSDDMPVYVISVAAHLSGMHPQTLRGYERVGLVAPRRATGGGRRYSMRDILALREIQRLSQEEGINLSGIKRILDLERELDQAQLLAAEAHAEVAQLRAELASTRAVAARLAELLRSRTPDTAATLVPVRSATRAPFREPPVTGPQPPAKGPQGAQRPEAAQGAPRPEAAQGAPRPEAAPGESPTISE
jgi:MerR family transcriptional regulator, heat shock protein HspR